TAIQNAVARATAQKATSVKGSASSTSRLLLILLVVAGAVAGTLAVLIIRSVVLPVRGLAARLESLSDHCLEDLADGLEAAAAGALTRDVVAVRRPLEVNATDELGRLAATFNAMLAKAQRGVGAYGAMRRELSGLIGEVSRTAGSVSATSQQVATTSD